MVFIRPGAVGTCDTLGATLRQEAGAKKTKKITRSSVF
jgi:hypothetical protein